MCRPVHPVLFGVRLCTIFDKRIGTASSMQGNEKTVPANVHAKIVKAFRSARDFRTDGILRDGTRVIVRAIRPDDKIRLNDAFQRLTAGSVYRRFFAAKAELTADDLRRLTELDFVDHVGLAVTVGEDAHEAFIGVGRFVRDTADAGGAEIAVIVADEYRNRGVGTLLLTHLASLARSLRIKKFVAIVQADNREIFELLQNSGLPFQARPDGDAKTEVAVAAELGGRD